MSRFRFISLLLIGGFLVAQEAPELLSTAQDRTDLGITIYHGGLAMIRDTRRVSLPAGRSRLAFADVAASIRPKSAWMTFKGGSPTVLERNFEFDLLSPQSLLDRSLGKAAGFRGHDEAIEWGELASLPLMKPRWAPGRTPLQRLARIGPMLQRPDSNVLVSGEVGFQAVPGSDLLLKHRPDGLRASPTLLMDLEAPEALEGELELAYTAEDFHWEASYTARLAPTGRSMDLDGFVTLTNTSGQSFKDASLQLVAGDPNKLDDPPPRNPDEPMVDATTCYSAETLKPRFKEERLSDYLLLSLDRPVTLGNGQTKQIKLFSKSSIRLEASVFIPFEVDLGAFFELEARSHTPGNWTLIECPRPEAGGHVDAIHPRNWTRSQVLLHLRNLESAGLDRPLPQGRLSLRLLGPTGSEIPIEELPLEATPVGEEAFILVSTLPASGMNARLRWRPTRWRKNWMELEAEAEVRNEQRGATETLLRVGLPEGTEIRSSELPATLALPGTFDFRLSLPAHATRTLRFTARVPKSGLPFSY